MKYTNFYTQGCCQDLRPPFPPQLPQPFPPCPPRQPSMCSNDIVMFLVGYFLGRGLQ